MNEYSIQMSNRQFNANAIHAYQVYTYVGCKKKCVNCHLIIYVIIRKNF